jgi:hypothetical protein
MVTLPKISKSFTSQLPLRLESIFAEYNDIPEKYLSALSNFAFGMQMEQFFTVHFQVPEMVSDLEIKELDHYVQGITDKNVKAILTSNELFRDLGCLFCRGISLPGFGASPKFMSPGYRDFKGTPYASRIEIDNQLALTFFDTHISFTDFVLRPWAILAAHHGFLARDPQGIDDPFGPQINGLRVDVVVNQIARTGNEIQSGGAVIATDDLKVVKRWVFTKACPVNIGSGQDYIQSHKENTILRKVLWTFEDYYVNIP